MSSCYDSLITVCIYRMATAVDGFYRPRSCGKVMFSQASVILFTGGGPLSPHAPQVTWWGVSVQVGLCPGVSVQGRSLSRGSLSRWVSVQGVSVWGSLSRGGLCLGGLCLGSICPGEGVCPGAISVQEGAYHRERHFTKCQIIKTYF